MESCSRPDLRLLACLLNHRARVDSQGVHKGGVRLEWQPHDHPLSKVGALRGAALPLVGVLVPTQRLRAEELPHAEVTGEHLVWSRRLGLRPGAAYSRFR